MKNKIRFSFIYIQNFSLGSLQNILPTLPRAMCTIRLSTHYYGQINNFHQKRKNNIFLCLWILSEGKQWHSMVHKSCQKAHGRPAKLIFQCMWHKIFVNGEPGMKNHVDCIWLALLVQPNVGGTNEFFTHPKWIFYPSKMDFLPIQPNASHELKISSLPKFI